MRLFGIPGPGHNAKEMEARAVQATKALLNPSREQERLERNLAKGRRQFDRQNRSRTRHFWRVWEFLFGRGEIRIHRDS